MPICVAVGNASGESANATIFVYGSQNSGARTHFVYSTSSDLETNHNRMEVRSVTRTVNTVVNNVKYTFSGGNILSGIFKLWGIRK
jgi:hypothetical protein